MLAGTTYVHKITRTELCELLDCTEENLAVLRRRHDLPAPDTDDIPADDPASAEAEQWWRKDEIREWLRVTRYRAPRELLVEWWPDAVKGAALVGAETVRSEDRPDRIAAVLQYWQTEPGLVIVAWGIGYTHLGGVDIARWAPDADAYLIIGFGWARRGPDVWAWPGAFPTAPRGEIPWRDLTRVLGRPAPFWPSSLRHPELIAEWRPGDPLVHHVSLLPVNIEPLLRMSLLYPVDHVVHRALVHTAQVLHNRALAGTVDTEILAGRLADGSITESDIVLAADVVRTHNDGLPNTLDEALVRLGWREILYRSDRLAEQCVEIMREWDGGRLWPFAQYITIPRRKPGYEFLLRLSSVAQRTAVYRVLDGDGTAIPMVDPLTDIPVAVPADDAADICALTPQRLPTNSPLASVILDEPIWIRTEDGMIYPAPADYYSGLNWGYSGSGPSTLAALVQALLADVTAVGASVGDDASAGLFELFEQPWPVGTTFTRAQLEAARDRDSASTEEP